MVPWSWKSSNVLLSPVLAWILNQRIQEQSPDNPFTLKDRLTVPVVRAGQRGGLLPPLEPCASAVELGDDSLSLFRWQRGCPVPSWLALDTQTSNQGSCPISLSLSSVVSKGLLGEGEVFYLCTCIPLQQQQYPLSPAATIPTHFFLDLCILLLGNG